MKKSSIYIPILAVTLTATLTTGCKKELRSQITPGKEVTVTLPGITIQQEQFVWPDFQTTAASTVAAAGEGTYPFTVELVPPTAEDSLKALTKADVSFTNLWVFQFGADENLVKSQQVASVAAKEDITVTLTSGEGYIIGLIANAPDDFSSSGVTNLDQFHEALFSHASINPDALPYVGEISGVTVKDGGIVEVEGQDVPTIMVQRVTAEINLNLTYNVTGYTLDGVEMYNVPLNGVYQPSTAVYPTEAASNFTYTDNTATGFVPQKKDEGAGTATETKKYTWYIHANQRGSVTSITTQQDKNSTTAPRYATYLRVKTHLNSNSFYELYYDIYLGENMLSDFNVKGNHTYTFNTRIAGFGEIHQNLPQQDKRVTYRPLNVVISPITDEIPQQGQTYTVTINSEKAWDAPIKIRAVYAETNEDIETKDIEYNAGSQGGSTQIEIPINDNEQRRLIQFDYQVVGQWLQAIVQYQQGTLIDVGATILLENPDPNKSCTWQEAYNYCQSKNTNGQSGWRLPTTNDLAFYWCIMPSLSVENNEALPSNRSYWSGKLYNDEQAFVLSSSGGYISMNDKDRKPATITKSYFVRCVKTANRNYNETYPKVNTPKDGQGGYIIELYDTKTGMGIPTSALYPSTLNQTTTGYEVSANNRMSRRFRVQSDDQNQGLSWESAKTYCDNLTEYGFTNWRLPSQREAILLMLVGATPSVTRGDMDKNGDIIGIPLVDSKSYLYDLEGFTPLIINRAAIDNPDGESYTYYWTSNQVTGAESTSSCISTEELLVGRFGHTSLMYVRCVRDEEW